MSNTKKRFSNIELLEPRMLFSADVFVGALGVHEINEQATDLTNNSELELEHQQIVNNSLKHEDTAPPAPLDQAIDNSLEQVPASNLFYSAQNPDSHLEVVFVETNTPNYHYLLDNFLTDDGANRQFDVVLIDHNENGLQRISETLTNYQNLDAIHIISHASDARLELGSTHLDSTTLIENRESVSRWSDAFAENADILIYGCNLTETIDGQVLIDQLSELTKADIAASDDTTGHKTLDGDWDLEYSAGNVTTDVAVSQITQATWQGTLDVSSGLVSHHTFDADATDSSSSNNGILVGGASINTSAGSNHIGAGKLDLDGSGDHVALDTHAASYNGLIEGTIAAWVRTTDTGENTIFGVSDSGDSLNLLKLYIETGQLKWLNYNNALADVMVSSDATVNDGNWHHVAVTVGSGGNTLYIDGLAAAVSYTAGSSAVSSFAADITDVDAVSIGQSVRNSSAEAQFDGLIDDHRVYDRALSSSDIAELYNSTVEKISLGIDDTVNTNADTAVVFNPTANDIDANGDTVAIAEFTQPSNGNVINNGNGTLTYTPDPSFTGSDSIEYVVVDTGAGLQHYWGLDGNANDSMGGHDGLVTGTTKVPGDLGGALQFNESVSDYVKIADTSYANEFTISFEFKVSEINGSLFQYLYSHGDVNSVNSINIFINEASHGTDPEVLRTVVRDTDDSLDNSALQVDISASGLNLVDNQFHTYALKVSEGGLEVFIDGVSVATDATRGTGTVNPSGSLFLGARQDLGTDRFFGGTLDTVQIFDNALINTQIADLALNENRATVNVAVSPVPQTYTVINTNDSGSGSLRQAILDANTHTGHDTIDFNIAGLGSHIVNLNSALPTITETVTVDGTTQASWLEQTFMPIILDGNDVAATGLQLADGADGSTIRGLIVRDFSIAGISIDADSSSNTIAGNWLGQFNSDGSDAGVSESISAGAIDIDGSNNIIGGVTAADRNVIMGGFGIYLYSSSSFGNTISGNYLGTDITGSGVLASGGSYNGIVATNGANNNTIGGASDAHRNIISGQEENGIDIEDSNTASFTIQNNWIGLGADGTTVLGVGDHGIYLHSGDDHVIGGIGTGNVIVDAETGIFLAEQNDNITIQGNFIGSDKSGAVIAGNDVGIKFEYGSSGATVGGVNPGEGNVITASADAGIITDNNTGTVNNTFRGNSIYGNDGPGIDLGGNGITANDSGDTDTGPNNHQNWATLTAAAIANDSTFSYDLDTTTLAAGNYTIDFYASSDRDAGHVEGKRYIGSIPSITNGSSSLTGTMSGITLAPGEYVTLITTDINGNSSEFSNYAITIDSDAGGTIPSDIFMVATNEGGLRINSDGGDNTYLQADDGGAIFGGLSSFTVEVQFSSTDSSTHNPLFSYSAGSNNEVSLGITSSGDLQIAINGGPSITSTAMDYATLEDGARHSIALTWDNGSGDWQVYADGVIVESGTGQDIGATLTGGGTLIIGQEQDSNGGSFDTNNVLSATLYDVRIFDDVRSTQEISSSYGSDLPYNESGMLANWKFNQLSGDGVITDSVRGNNLALKHTSETGFTAGEVSLTLVLDENAIDRTVVGKVSGIDIERDAHIANLLAADPSLTYSATTNRFYQFVEADLDASAAITNATSSTLNGISGNLISIQSATENQIAVDILNANGATQAYIGASDADVEGEWRWVDSTTPNTQFWQGDGGGYNKDGTYAHWFTTNPDNYLNNQNFAKITATSSQWDDLSGASPEKSIIEYAADAVLDTTQELTYSILSQTIAGTFEIDATTGEIRVLDGSLLNADTQPTHTITIRTTDSNFNTYQEAFKISLNNLLEPSTAPTDISSGIALNSDGGNDAYLFADDGGDLLGGMAQITFETSFTTSDSGYTPLISYASSDNDFLVELIGNGTAKVHVNNSTISFSGMDYNTLLDGQQHSFAVSWDNTNGDVYIYVDGAMVDSATGLATGETIAGSTGSGALVLGQEQDSVGGGFSTGQVFNGTLYDVRIWDEVRSAAEISLNHRYKFDTESLPSRLVANWQMDGFDSNIEVVDVVSNNNLNIGQVGRLTIDNWTNQTGGVTVNGNTLTYVDDVQTTGWNSQINSANMTTLGFIDDYTIRFTLDNTTNYKWSVGLSATESSTSFNDIEYAIFVDYTGDPDDVDIKHNGTTVGTYDISFNAGGEFGFYVNGTTLEYQYDGVTFATDSIAASADWYIDTSFYMRTADTYNNQDDYSLSNFHVVDGNGRNADGFTSSTIVDNLHISKLATVGASIGYVVPSAPDISSDVIKDGQFLDATTTFGAYTNYSSTGTTFGQWTLTEDGTISVAEGGGFYGETAPGGGYLVHLQDPDSAIATTFATEAGKQYQVIFSHAGDWVNGTRDHFTTRVTAAGESVDFVLEKPDDYDFNYNAMWQDRSFTFTAHDVSTSLQFASMEQTHGDDALLADIRVIELHDTVTTILNNDATLSFDAATDKFYRHVDSATLFTSALTAATTEKLNGVSGQLINIDSDYENNLIRQLVIDSGRQLWLGASDATVDGQWRWLDGDEETELFYNGQTPGAAVNGEYSSDVKFDNGTPGDTLRILADGSWNDSTDSASFGYVIEWRASEVISNFTFSLTDASNNFDIDNNTGEITVAATNTLDYQTATSHDVDVTVTDAAGKNYMKTMSISVDSDLEAIQSIPAAQTIEEDTTLTFASGTATQISVTDTAATVNSPLRVSLLVNDGVLTLSQTTGLTIVEGSDASSWLVIDGAVSDINSALDGMTFTPNSSFNGSVTLNMTSDLAADLTAHFTFESDSLDQSHGQENNGTMTDGAAIVTDPIRGNVLDVSAASDEVTILPKVEYDDEITISAWINVPTFTGDSQAIVSLGNNIILTVKADGSLQGRYRSSVGSTWNSTQESHNYIGTGWHHVSYTVNSNTNVQQLFVDGTLKKETNFTEVMFQAGRSDHVIGRTAVSNSDPLNGLIDDVRIYTRAILVDEVAAIAEDQEGSSYSTEITVTPVNDTPTFSLPESATFGTSNSIPSSTSGQYSIATADIDADGDIDVLSASPDDDTIAWYENDGNQVYTQHIITNTANYAHDVTTADLDDDGDLDVLSASRNDNTIAWYKNDGSQAFTKHIITNTAVAAQNVTTADIDGDGDQDVLSASTGDDTIAWYENNGSQVFTKHVVTSTADSVQVVTAADVDNDGDLDLVAAFYSKDQVAWYENDGNQVFTERVITNTANGARSVTTADVDGDGDLDLLAASDVDDSIAWYENDGGQVFTKVIISNIAGGVSDITTADLDGDGDLDVVTAGLNDDTVAWYENDGNQVFTKNVITTTAYIATSVTTADVDGDGDPDVLSASLSGDKLAWYENQRVSSLGGTVSFTEGGTQVVLDSDVDIRDADLDALNGGLGNYNGASLTILRSGGANAQDDFSFLNGNGISKSGFLLLKNGEWIGTFSQSTPGELTIDFFDTPTEKPTSADVDNILRQITFENTNDSPPSRLELEWTFNDGNAGAQGSGGASTTVGFTTVNITATNDKPAIDNLSSDSLNYSEGDGVVVIDQGSDALVSDPDSTDFDGGYLNVSFHWEGVKLLEDALAIRNQGTAAGQIGVSGSNVTYGGTIIGTFTGGASQVDLQIDFNANADATVVSALTRNITFEDTNNDNPTTGTRLVEFLLNDGDGATSSSLTAEISLSAVNDTPTADDGGPYSISEGDTLNLDSSGTTDVDSGSLTYRWDLDNDGQYDDLVTSNASETITWSTLKGLGIDDDDSYSIGLQVDDGDGVTNSTTTLTVANIGPTLTAAGDATVDAGSNYTLNLNDVDPGNDSIASWVVNWGDGSIDTFVGDPSSVSHTYPASAIGQTFDITVSALDEDGQWFNADALIPLYYGDRVVRVDGSSGVTLDTFAPPSDGIGGHTSVVHHPNGNYLVSGFDSGNVLEYTPTGVIVGTFIDSGDVELSNAAGMAFGPDGNLYIASSADNEVLRYDASGNFIDEFVPAGTEGITTPQGLAFDDQGNLYVASKGATGILKFDSSGVHDGGFTSTQSPDIKDLTIGPDGLLYTADLYSGIQRYNAITGTFIDTFIVTDGTLLSVSGVEFGPDGKLYVADQDGDAIRRYDPSTGAYIDNYKTGSNGPAYLEFEADHRVTINIPVPPVLSDGVATTNTEGSISIPFASSSVTDADSTDFDGGTMTATISSGLQSEDLLQLGAGNGVTRNGNEVLVDGVLVGTYAGDGNNTPLTVSFNSDATLARVEKVMQGITFRVNSDDPVHGIRTLSVSMTDGNGGNSNTATGSVNVNNSINDSPALTALDGNPSFVENSSPVVLDADVDLSDPELDNLNSGNGNYSGASLTIHLNGSISTDDLLNFSDGNGITLLGGALIKNSSIIASFDTTSTVGELVITFTDTNGEIPTSVDVENSLRQIIYSNSSQTPPASVQLDWKFDDGNTGDQGSGGAKQATGSTTIDIIAVNQAPKVDSGLGDFTGDFSGAPSRSDIGKVSYDSDNMIAVDTDQIYNLSVNVSTGDGAGGNIDPTAIHYLGVKSFDIDGNEILTQHVDKFSGAVDTTLAVDLVAGATQIVLNDASGWHDGGNSYQRSLAWYGYTNSLGETYSDYTYTQNVESNLWDENSIVGNVITLRSAWTGPTILAGDAVRNATFGATYQYAMLDAQTVPTSETLYTATFGDGLDPGTNSYTEFRHGTAYLSPLVLGNFMNTSNQLNVSDFTIQTNQGTSVFTEDAGPISITDDEFTIIDPDDMHAESFTITLSNGKIGDILNVNEAALNALGIAVSGVPTESLTTNRTITLTLTSDTADSVTFQEYSDAIDEIAFNNTSDDPNTTDRVITMVVNDGIADSATETVVIKVHSVDDLPVANTIASSPTFTENEGAVGLFSGTSIDPVEAGETISSMIFTVDQIADGADEILIIDGTPVSLTDLYTTTTTITGYEISVAVSGSTATVMISSGSAISSSAAETLIDNLQYNNTYDEPSGTTRSVTFTSVSDSDLDGVHDTTVVGIGSTVSMVGSNDVPVFELGDGIVVTDISGGTDAAKEVIIQPNGKIIVAGVGYNGTDDDFSLVRYNANGTLDTSFGGGNGYVTTDISGNDDLGQSIALQADGKIVVVGSAFNGTYHLIAAVRYNSDGMLDTSFGGGDGIVTTSIGSGDSHGYDIRIQDDGKILVAGESSSINGKNFTLLRYNSDGTLDTSFGGSNGVMVTDIGTHDDISYNLRIQPDGKILLAGSSYNGSNTDFAVTRYNANGTLDTSFGSGSGIVTTDIGPSNDVSFNIEVQADGKILLTGYNATSGGPDELAITRYESNGNLDTSFGGGDGIVTTSIGGVVDAGYSVAPLSDGKIAVGALSLNGANYDFALLRYQTDGTLDTGFGGGDGIVSTDIGLGTDIAYTLAIQDDGNFLLGGASTNSSGDQNFAIVRYNNDGTLDTTFDSAGMLNNNAIYIEQDTPVVLDSDVDIRDTELDALVGGHGDYDGSSLTISRVGLANTDDVFGFNDDNGITLNSSLLYKNGQVIATFNQSSAGTLSIQFSTTQTEVPSSADVDHILRQITYQNPSDSPPTHVELEWTFDDGNLGAQGSGGSATATGFTTVSITPTNDLPSIINLAGDSLNYAEGDEAVLIDQGADILVSDPDSLDFAGGQLNVSFFLEAVNSLEDELAIRNQGTSAGQIGVSSNDVIYQGTVIGTFSGGSGAVGLQINFNANADATAVSALAQNITFETTNITNPVTGQRLVEFTLSDGDGSTSAAVRAEVNVTNVNDAPTFSGSGSVSLNAQNEDAGAPVGTVGTVINDIVSIGGNVSDVDTGSETGIAVIAADSSDGIWWYTTNNGVNWNLVGNTSDSSARVLNADSNTRLYFESETDFSGSLTDAIIFRAWDRSEGSNGSLQDTSTNGGTTAYSPTTNTAHIAITPINDNPQLVGANSVKNGDFSAGLLDWNATDNVDSYESQARFGQIGGANGTLSQTLATEVGKTYILTFDYGDQSASQSQSMNVDVVGGLTLVYANLSTGLANSSLQTYQYSFVADSSSTTIAFTDTSDDHSAVVGYLDNVSVAADARPNKTIDYYEGDAASIIDSTLTIKDIDDTNIESALVAITGNYASGEDVLTFVDQNGITGIWSVFGGTLTLTGSTTLSNYETALRSITFVNTSDEPSSETRTISITVNDGDTSSNTQTRGIIVTTANDDPNNAGSLPSDSRVTEDLLSNVDLSAVNFSDVDASAGTLTVTLTTSTGGQLSALTDAGISLGGSAVTRTFTGTLTDLNAYFNTASNIQYIHATPHTVGNDADTITVTINDNGSTGSGGGTDQILGIVNVDIATVNDEEVLATNTGTTVAEGTTGNVITTAMLETIDIDHANAQLVYTVDAVTTYGTLRLSGISLGLNDNFTQADIAAGSVTYDHDGSQTTSDEFNFSVDDGMGTDTSATFDFTVTNVNDAPVNTVPVTLSIDEDTTLAIADFSVVDNDDNLSTVELRVNDGSLNVTVSGAATISSGSNDSDDLTLSGSLSDINATLASLTYQSSANFYGNDTLSVLSTDNNTATDTDALAITVNPINDAPLAIDNTIIATEDIPLIIGPENFTFFDRESDSLASVSITNLSLNSGTLTHSAGAVTVTNGMVISAADLVDLTFTSAPNSSSNSNFTYSVNDADFGVASAAMSIIVNNDNDAPSITSHGGASSVNISSTENQTSVTVITATDSDLQDTLKYKLAGGPDAALFSIDSNSGALTFVNAPNFEHPQDAGNDGVHELEIAVIDSAGGIDTQHLSIAVTDINESPTRIALSNNTIDEHTNTDKGYSIGSLSTKDEDISDTHSYTIVGGVDASLFSIGGANSNELIITAGDRDFDTKGYFEVTVQAIDSSGNRHIETLTITVMDFAETPIITSVAPDKLNEDGIYEYLITTSSADNPTTTITAAALPDWLTISDNGDGTATVTGTPQYSDIGEHQVEITVSNGTTQSHQIYTIIVNEDDILPSTENASEATINSIVDPVVEQVALNIDPEHDTEPTEEQVQGGDGDKGDELTNTSIKEDPSHESSDLWNDDLTPLEAVELVAIAEALSPDSTTKMGTQFNSPPAKFIDLNELNLIPFNDELPELTSFQSIMNNKQFLDELVEMKNDMDEALKADEKQRNVLTEVTFGISLSLTAGFVTWIFKSGSLIASFLSVIPVWKQFDPLPILSSRKLRKPEGNKDKKDKVERFFRAT